MTIPMKAANLTRRENEIAELIAWGATKKEIAQQLTISVRTVENITRSIFEKTEVTKANELAAWWFCTHFNVSFDLSPVKRSVIAIFLLLIVFPAELAQEMVALRTTTSVSARASRGGRKSGKRSKEFEIPCI